MVAEEEHMKNEQKIDLLKKSQAHAQKYPHRYPQQPDFALSRYIGAVNR